MEQQAMEQLDVKVLNLCDHDINIKDVNGKIWTIHPAADEPARVSNSYTAAFYLGTIGVNRKIGSTNSNLPPTTEGTMYIVSRAVAESNQGRRDLMYPGPQYYTDEGLRFCVGLMVCN